MPATAKKAPARKTTATTRKTPAPPRAASRGDVAPSKRANRIEKFVAQEATQAAQAKATAAALELLKPDALSLIHI